MSPSPNAEWYEPAPAKINLALHIVGQRSNGYHELESLCVFTQLCDELTVQASEKDELVLTGPFAAGLRGERSNIVLKALALFRQKFPDSLPSGLKIKLIKALPVAAGIGGGSADAAAMLRLANRLSGLNLTVNDLKEIALELGADVPMCLLSRTAFVDGVGEHIEALPEFPTLQLVLANPGKPVSTADIFRKLREKQNPPLKRDAADFGHITAISMWLEGTRNDLQKPAIEYLPEIADMMADLGEQKGCLLSRMSGSGATIFGVFGSSAEAMLAAQSFRKNWPHAWVAQSATL
ncbi:4-(cytidine 5'-diphospho)-2-C-methyl-D-erythritol kinase [Maritalea mediterranea]|uniref:4-diphosphocytidyl-2-C-methyl-D-erythritol kinase n=1 Tax=Maritalea mediterranea TaxID=2909667 RepID=A0ABS9E7G2_9HYPH|nr:4-(cytidine 5'-diphospho)-2-C-methyl-D-erythritol kinase [Maritalea mediterranea]MCF4097844.1 4-(cytidine 5'-diphospho)-2-C-methyl-D-erythritol kinase [Maritalea mediterranea]